MAFKSPGKLIGQLKQPQYTLLKSLTEEQPLDAGSLQATINDVVNGRFALARGLIEAAKTLADNENPLVRRSAVSRAYYGAYHAARAMVFAIRRHDEDDHDKLAQAVDSILEGRVAVGAVLKNLRRLRNEMDYSPFPGPDPRTQYDAQEIDTLITQSLQQADELVGTFERHLQERK